MHQSFIGLKGEFIRAGLFSPGGLRCGLDDVIAHARKVLMLSPENFMECPVAHQTVYLNNESTLLTLVMKRDSGWATALLDPDQDFVSQIEDLDLKLAL